MPRRERQRRRAGGGVASIFTYTTWGKEPLGHPSSAANQDRKNESAVWYENENFRSRRPCWAVACAVRGLWCACFSRGLRIRAILGPGFSTSAASASRSAGDGVLRASSHRRDATATHCGRRSQPSWWKFHRRDAGTAGRATGSPHAASHLESHLGSRLLDMAQ